MIGPKDQLKIDVITKVMAKAMDQKLASQIMHVHRRTISRWTKRYKEKGVLSLLHGNKGKPGPNRKPDNLKQQILNLICEYYFEFNIKHIFEKLPDHNLNYVSYKTLLRWCHEKKFIKKIRKKRHKIHRARPRMPQRGLLLQMDGSHHEWFGKEKSCLIAAIDDADSDIAYGEFFKSEDTLSCMKVVQKIIETKGAFNVLYVDRAGVFGGPKRTDFCQLEDACKQLGVQIIYAYTPEAKGRVERLWRTLQGRLIAEMRLRGINNIIDANNYFQQDFIPNQYRKNFLVPPISEISAYRSKYSSDFLSEIFCFKETRVVKNDQTFSYLGRTFIINSNINCAKGLVEIRLYQNKKIKYFYRENEISVSYVRESKMAA